MALHERGCIIVALRKESVDRNTLFLLFRPVAGVALRKESVDRNSTGLASFRACITSLSARRAWIEMLDSTHRREPFRQSLSARRAWIEILITLPETLNFTVALRKESVDRNLIMIGGCVAGNCRSPQGERG